MKRVFSKVLSTLLIAAMMVTQGGTSYLAQVSQNQAVEVLEQSVSQNETISDNETVSENDNVPDDQDVSDVIVPGDEQVSGNEVVQDGSEVSDNETVSSNDTISENDVAATDDLFPGMPEGYVLSAKQMKDKSIMRQHASELGELREGIDCAKGELLYLEDDEETARKIAEAYGGELHSFLAGIAVAKLADGVTVAQATAAAMDDSAHLPAVWPNYYLHADETATDDLVNTEERNTTATLFNDPFLDATNSSYQWAHEAVGSQYAWDVGAKGVSVNVAVLDTGLDKAHDDISAETCYLIADDQEGTISETTTDTAQHGTHVAGIIGATANNGVGGSGIAPGCTLTGIAVLTNNGSGTSDQILRGLYLASGLVPGYAYKADIINMSLGGPSYSAVEQEAFTKVYNKGVTVIAAAGNDSSNVPHYPAAYDHVISVGALYQNGQKTNFSNYGAGVDLAMPGYAIYSTIPFATDVEDGSQDGYYSMNGTSQATPVATGVAACILSARADIRGKEDSDRVNALESLMKKSAIKSSSSGMGAGMVYLPKALGLATLSTAPKAPVFSVKAGSYTADSVTVAIEAPTLGCSIYYTTDGKAPSYTNGTAKNCIPYVVPVELSGAAKKTLKAIAVNANGKVSAISSATYNLKPIVKRINITTPTGGYKIAQGKKIKLKASVTPSYAVNKQVTWGTAENYSTKGVSIDKKGVVSVKADATLGNYTITATAKDSGAKVGSIDLTVIGKDSAIKSIKFAKSTVKSEFSLYAYNLEANPITVTKSDNTPGSTSDVIFSSSKTSVATVNETTGEVIIIGSGKAKITATANDGSGVKATYTVTVSQKTTDVNITGSNCVARGKSIQLKAVAAPDKATDKAVVWSIEPANSGVSVSKKGKVTATKSAVVGDYTVKAMLKSDNAIIKPYSITVTDTATSKITLSKTSINLFTTASIHGAPTTATLTASGCTANAVQYTNSNPQIASFDATTGLITAHNVGKTVITCKAIDGSGKKAKCTVNVLIPASRMWISPKGGMVNVVGVGKKVGYSAKMESKYGSPSSKGVKWSSSNTGVATVDKNGNVKGISTGTTTITAVATDGSNMYAEYQIEVIPATKKLTISHMGNGIFEISGNSYLYDYAITSSNPYVLGVNYSQYYDAFMICGGKKYGMTTITVKALDGSGKKAKVRIFSTGLKYYYWL